MPARKSNGEDDENEIVPEEEGEESDPKRQRRHQREIRDASSRKGGRFGMRAEVGSISYTPPETVRSEAELIRAGDLRIDPRYNRDVQQHWVDQIAEAFNPDQLQVLNVSRRLFRVVQRPQGEAVEEQVFDGLITDATRVELVVISGQHRLLATLKAKGEDFLLQCNVYDTLSSKQEAELFALFDEKVRPHQPWQRHRAHVFGGNPEALEIERIVTESGLVVYKGRDAGTQDGVIYAVSTLYSIVRSSGPEALQRVLNMHYAAWTDNQDGYTAPMLQGTAYMLRRFGVYAMWRDEYLAQALSDPAHNPLSVRQRAQGAASGISATSIAQEVARLEHRYYQSGKKGYQRLPEWNATTREIQAQSDAALARSKTTGKREEG